MLWLTRATGSPYRVLHRSRETSYTMTTAVAPLRVNLDPAPAVPRTAAAGWRAPAATEPQTNAPTRAITLRFATEAAIRPVDTPPPHARLRAGTA